MWWVCVCGECKLETGQDGKCVLVGWCVRVGKNRLEYSSQGLNFLSSDVCLASTVHSAKTGPAVRIPVPQKTKTKTLTFLQKHFKCYR